MIDFISGTVAGKQGSEIVLSVLDGHIGVAVLVSLKTLEQVPGEGQKATLYGYLTFRDDGVIVFGFIDKLERQIFKLLIRVNGLGPKLAITILSNLTSEQLIESVLEADLDLLVGVPGVGKKMAERIILELKSIVGKIDFIKECSLPDGERDIIEDVRKALEGLGFAPSEANKAAKGALKGKKKDLKLEEVVLLALRNINS